MIRLDYGVQNNGGSVHFADVSPSVPFCCVEKLGYSRKMTRMEDGIRKVLGGKSGSVTLKVHLAL